MMSSPVAGIDPHQDTYTIGIVDPNGVELAHAVFPTSAAGYGDGIELLTAQCVRLVGIEGSAGLGFARGDRAVCDGFRLPRGARSAHGGTAAGAAPGQDRPRRRCRRSTCRAR